MQSEARELLASNQLYRVTASNSGDSELAGALDRLEGVLAEIANDPNLTAADLNRVRKDMNTKGILFEIRVLQSRNQDQGTKGAIDLMKVKGLSAIFLTAALMVAPWSSHAEMPQPLLVENGFGVCRRRRCQSVCRRDARNQREPLV